MQPCQYLIQQLRNLVSIYAFIQIHVQHWHLQILFNTEIHNVEYKEINGNRNVNRDCSFNGVNHDSWVTQQIYLGEKMHMLNKRLHIELALRQNFTKVLYTSLFCTSSIAWNYIFINRSSCWQESKKSYILLSTGNYDYANQHGIFSHGEQDKLLVKVATMLTMFIILLNYSIIFDRREQEKLLSTNHAN